MVGESTRFARLRVACVQVDNARSYEQVAERVSELVPQAAGVGADVIVLPERWTGYGDPALIRAAAEPIPEGRGVRLLSELARGLGVTIVGGSLTETVPDSEKYYNTSVVFDPDGHVCARYRKVHLFDVDLPDRRYRESDLDEPGRELATFDVHNWTVGLSICYDLRFPELYRGLALAGAEILAVPSAFALYTGRDHWEVLLRARAIENGCFVVAADSFGGNDSGARTYGRSMIVDPWGVVLAQAGDRESVIVADLDRAELERVRSSIPSLRHRMPDVYELALTTTARSDAV